MNPWSLFWRQGHSTTFGDYFKQGYVGAVADWWQLKLNGLPENPTVMELGCGNCSLLPAMIASGLKGKYIGVDIAEVSPSPVAQKGLTESGIELVLHSATPAEEIPEPDASADLVASVFGIEYSDMERSVPEAARLLKPGGRFCALLHHDNSLITSMSRRAISEYSSGDLRKVIESLTIISSERDRIANLSELKTSYKAEKGRKKINLLAQKYLSDTNLQTMNATMFEVMTQALKFFRMMGASSQQRRDFIASLEAEQRASHERFKQMVSVAFDAEGIGAVKATFEETGFRDVKTEVIYSDKDILAWELQGNKS